MIFKVALLILGLLAMAALISSKVAAGELGETSSISRMVEVVKEQNDVGDVKRDKKPCVGDIVGKDCFGMPGMPGMPAPGMPTPWMPGMPAPGMPAPGMPGMPWPGTGTTPGMPGGGYGGGPGGPGAKGPW